MISYKLLGTREWFVIHHSNCGMELFTDEIMGNLLERSLETATMTQEGWKDVGAGPGSVVGKFIKWHTISNAAQSVLEDVERIRKHPLVPRTIPVHGYIYDVKTGRLNQASSA